MFYICYLCILYFEFHPTQFFPFYAAWIKTFLWNMCPLCPTIERTNAWGSDLFILY